MDEKSNNWVNPPKRPRSPMDSGNNRKPPVCSCECPMRAAVWSVKQGEFRKARLYTRLGVQALIRRATFS